MTPAEEERMSTSMIRCPNCASVDVRSTKPDEYECTHYKARFVFIRPDIRRQMLSHTIVPAAGNLLKRVRVSDVLVVTNMAYAGTTSTSTEEDTHAKSA
jgi:hypothetical protein